MNKSTTTARPGESPPRVSPSTPAAPTRRRVLSAAGVGAAAALLASCAEEPRATTGHLLVTDDLSIPLPDLPARPDASTHALEVPGFRYRVAGTRILPSLPRSLAVPLGFLDDNPAGEKADADDEADDEVLAPTGEVFLVAELVTAGALVLPPLLPDIDVRSERIIVGGEPEEPRSTPMELGGTLHVALTVPEDPGPESVMLEVTCGDIVQRLSLVDGSRISSDMEHWYRQSVRATPEQIWWERHDERAGGELVLGGAVRAVQVQAALPDGTWPSPGQVMLGVELAVLPAPAGITPLYDLALLLPDGEETPLRGAPANEALAVPEHASPVWFEAPHDLETATIRVSLAARSADGEERDMGAEEIPLSLTRTER